MPTEQARLTVLLDAERKKAFDALCQELGSNASEVLRGLIAEYMAGGRPASTPVTGRDPGKVEPRRSAD